MRDPHDIANGVEWLMGNLLFTQKLHGLCLLLFSTVPRYTRYPYSTQATLMSSATSQLLSY